MSKFPKQNEIVTAVLNGISAAHENFFYWTNSRLSLSYGPSKIITIHVAQELAKVQDAPEIYIDATVADILKCSLSNKNSFGKFMQDNGIAQGTFSITLDERFEHKDSEDLISRVIISVNNAVRNTKQEYSDEVERICKMLTRSDGENQSLLDYGIFSFYADLSMEARKKLAKRVPEIIKSFDTIVQKYPHLKASFRDVGIHTIADNIEWCAGCYVIEPVNQ